MNDAEERAMWNQTLETRDAWGRPLDCPWCVVVSATWDDRERHINHDHPLAGKSS